MTNDAKLGMLAGVVGVLFAAVFLAKPPAQPAAVEQPAPAKPAAVLPVPSVPVSTPGAGVSASAAPAAFPSTPVARTRKDVPAQPTSRQPLADEEP